MTAVIVATLALLPARFQPDEVLARYTGAPPLTKEFARLYLLYYEWYFDLRTTAPEKGEFQALLIADYNRSGPEFDTFRQDIPASQAGILSFRKGNWMTISKFLSDSRAVDSIEESTEEMLGNGQIYGTGTKAEMRKFAKAGSASAQWLLSKAALRQKPLVREEPFSSSLMPKHIDSTYEWTAFRLDAVAGKPVSDRGEESRRKFLEKAVATWKRLKPNQKEWSAFASAVQSSYADWSVWRIGEFSFLDRMTPYQRKLLLAQWAGQLAPLSAEAAQWAKTRQSEYEAYVAKMPESELREERELRLKSDVEFAVAMAKWQQESQGLAQTVSQMRASMTSLHVANLNIAENLGNSGYEWTIKP